MAQPWKGIFVIVVTPFTPKYELDEESLRKEMRFCIEAGAHGLVGPANASEFATLSDDERKRWVEIVVQEAGGQIPVIATTTARAFCCRPFILSHYAENAGADGIMAMPPHILHTDADGCYDYFKALSRSGEHPYLYPEPHRPRRHAHDATLLARMCQELPHVEYIKEETLPEPRQISATIAAAGDACKGVFGGQGGVYLIDEYRRGRLRQHARLPGDRYPSSHLEPVGSG